MSQNNKQPSTNPLFSSSNLDFSPNALFMPVQENTSSAIFSPESDPAEEASFIGQAPSYGQEQQNVATFTMFSQNNDKAQDPFSSLTSESKPTSSAILTSEQQEPQLFVPPQASVQPTNPMSSFTSQSPATFSATPQSVSFQPPIYNNTPPVPTNIQSTPTGNPYARTGASGARPRAMFPPNPQMYQAPAATLPSNLYNTPPQSPPMTSISEPQIPVSSIAPPSFEALASRSLTPPGPPTGQSLYHPVASHWFYCKKLSDNNLVWCPFSRSDSSNLELALNNEKASNYQNSDTISTDGGRYDVSVSKRERKSVYWEEETSIVRRSSWFCKSDNENRYSPYEESIAVKLEAEYRNVVSNGLWHKRIELENGEVVVVHSPQLIVHFQPIAAKDEFGGVFETQMHSKVVKRGIFGTEFEKEIPPSEVGTPDHVVFLCHGIGPVCDLRSRSIVECGEAKDVCHLVLFAHGIGEGYSQRRKTIKDGVDDFRAIHLNLLQTHFKKGLDSNKAHRIEFLPIHWHRALHGDATGVDRNVQHLTLPSISRLRHFTNETLLDILFYSSPVYCQTIADTIGNEINSLYKLFLSRNPSFQGEVSLSGHSLGSLILFDLLCHQNQEPKTEQPPAQQQQPPMTNGNSSLAADTSSVLSVASDTGSNSLKMSGSSHSLSEAAADKDTLEDLLNRLNLGNFLSKFEDEQIDMDALMMCSEGDLKDIGLPMGPRKKLKGFLAERSERDARRKEEEARRAIEDELRQQQEAQVAMSLLETKVSAPLETMDSFGSFLSCATNVHVDFQQFDAGIGQPMVHYPTLDFHPKFLFALGSPIGVFLTVRGVSELGEDFALPTCPGFLNIFHPFDPVAYRMEPLINPDFDQKPILVPHYKGRKRMHLELKESLGRMGQELKQSIMRSVKLAVGSMQKFAQSHWNQAQKSTEAEVEQEVKTMTEQILRGEQDKGIDMEETASVTSDIPHADLGRLNGGKRIDYVLQERPLESFNDYLFAFQSHLCYWNNEDTVLLIMKELYGSSGVLTDRQIERQNMNKAVPSSVVYSPQGGPPMATIPLK